MAGKADLVYSPLVDAKEFPEDVDMTLVEGAVSSEEDLHKIKIVRERTKIAGFAGRLRGDRQRARNAQSVRRESGLRPRLPRKCRPSIPACPTRSSRRCCRTSRPVHEVRPRGRLRAGLSAVGGHDLSTSLTELLEGRTPDDQLQKRVSEHRS